MKSLNLFGGVAIVLFLLSGTAAMAQTVSDTDFSAIKARTKADFKADRNACDSLTSNAKDICVAQAKGNESVALAELDNRYKPTPKTLYKLRVAKGEAAYGVAIEKCDDLSGNPKDVCVKEAEAALTTAKADATAELKTGEANATARETMTEANATAQSEKQTARADAETEKRAAELKVALEKCEALASSAKDNCQATAKARFGKL